MEFPRRHITSTRFLAHGTVLWDSRKSSFPPSHKVTCVSHSIHCMREQRAHYLVHQLNSKTKAIVSTLPLLLMSCRKSSRSCHKTNNNQPWCKNLEIPWGSLAWDVLCRLNWGLCHARKYKLKVLRKSMVWYAIAQQTFAPDTFGKEWKWETNPVHSLLPGSHKHLALRETAGFVLETWGPMYYALHWSAQGMRKQEKRIWFPYSQERR